MLLVLGFPNTNTNYQLLITLFSRRFRVLRCLAKYQELSTKSRFSGPTAIAKTRLPWLSAWGKIAIGGHRLRGDSSDSYIAWEHPAHWECLWRLNGGHQTHWLQAFSGFPRSLTALFSKAHQQRFAGAAPGENLKRILNERRTEVNREVRVFDFPPQLRFAKSSNFITSLTGYQTGWTHTCRIETNRINLRLVADQPTCFKILQTSRADPSPLRLTKARRRDSGWHIERDELSNPDATSRRNDPACPHSSPC